MAKRSYHQYCGVAAALDLLGERWSLLIVRNLLLGPKRFTDLQDGLPGIGTGLLSQRLKELDAAGILTRATLPPPAASTVYRLTPEGEELRPVLHALSRWGMRRLGEPAAGQHVEPELVALTMEARFDAAAAPRAADGVYELRVDGQRFRFTLSATGIAFAAAPAEEPRAVLTADVGTLAALAGGRTTLTAAIDTGKLTASGDSAAIPLLAAAFALPR